MARKLLYLPMAHQSTDVSKSMRGMIGLDPARKMRFEKFYEATDGYIINYWKQVRPKLDAHNINKVYPEILYREFSGAVIDAFKELRDRGSRVASYILEMQEKGATVVPIEVEELVSAHMKLIISTTFIDPNGADVENEKKVMRLRDWHIARRIDCDLQEGETGLLMIGAGHSPPISGSIDVEYLCDPKVMMAELNEMWRSMM